VDAPSRTEFAPQSVAITRNGTPGQVEVCAALKHHERDDKRTESAVSRLSFEPSVISVRWQVTSPAPQSRRGERKMVMLRTFPTRGALDRPTRNISADVVVFIGAAALLWLIVRLVQSASIPWTVRTCPAIGIHRSG